MIDTDKYKGHLMDGDFQVWRWSSKMIKVANYEEQMATAELLRDAPLLLAEIKRIQMDNTMLENNLKDTKHRFNRAIERCNETKEELSAEVKRLREKLFEAELWVNNNSYTFENNIKELNDYAEARMNE